MDLKDITESIENGCILTLNKETDIGKIEWTKHPEFNGVFLKHLIKGSDADGKISCHLVKIDPEYGLKEHKHDSQWELHEVIDGCGSFILNNIKKEYYPGQMAVIPKGLKHEVTAGEKGLVLLAKFFPPLL